MCAVVQAQQENAVIDYTSKNTYEIGGITIIGSENRDRNAIKSISGLREGGKIQIPGPAVGAAIKSLLKLRLFDDVQIYIEKTEGNVVFLKMILIDRPTLSRWSFSGVKSGTHDDLNEALKNILTKGGIVTDDQKELAKSKIVKYFVEKGKLDTEVKVKEVVEEGKTSSVRLEFAIDPKDRVKVEDIVFEGNKTYSDKKLRKKMSKTKRAGTLFRKSKFIEKEYQEDLKSLTKFYQNEGFKNMTIISDTTYRNAEGNIMVNIKMDEGRKHYYRNISWKGNSLYNDEQLYTVLGLSLIHI